MPAMEVRCWEDFCLVPPGWTNSENDEDEQFFAELLDAFHATNNTPTKQDPPLPNKSILESCWCWMTSLKQLKPWFPRNTARHKVVCGREYKMNGVSSDQVVALIWLRWSSVLVPQFWFLCYLDVIPLFILEARKESGERYPPDTMYTTSYYLQIL